MVRVRALAMTSCVFAFLALLAPHLAYAHTGRVKSLPGYGPPPTAHYSGFVEVDAATRTNLFYYLVESQSAPNEDPLIWWMNGGPGASSFAGLLLENGPLLFNDVGKLVRNPYAWNRAANVLYVEFGPGVGFSYCSNSSQADPSAPCPQSRGDCSPCPASDSLVAQHNVVFLEKFLTEVSPGLAGRPLFLAGESYAGVYIPMLAASLVEHFKDTTVVNLHGMWVTDPCTDNKAQFGRIDINPTFCYEKGLISKEVYDALSDPAHGCSDGRTPVGDRIRKADSLDCRRAWRLYDIATAGIGNAVHPPEVPGLPMYIDPLNAYGPSGPETAADPSEYLSRPDVREALHATASPNKVYHLELGNNGYTGYELEYAACNNGKNNGKSMIDVYQGLLASAKSAKSASNLKRILLSSGDIDPVVNMKGTEAAVQAIGLPVALGGDRRPWFYNATATDIDVLINKPVQWGPTLRAQAAGAQVGGFVINYETGLDGFTFDFVAMRDSGHMVPAYDPQGSLHVIYNTLVQGKPLTPLLPADWDTSSENAFYGWKTEEGGTFTAWVKQAMTDVSTLKEVTPSSEGTTVYA